MSTISDALKESRQVELVLELTYGDTAVRRLATRSFTIPSSTGDPKLFRGRLRQPLELGSSYDLTSGTYSLGRVPVEIENESRIQDLEKSIPIEDITGKAYIWCDGLTWEDIQAAGLIFEGKVAKRYHTLSTYSFDLEDLQYTTFQTAPPAIIDLVSWPNHRASGVAACSGKAVPLIYGDCPKTPAWCVDPSNAVYIICHGTPKTTDADYDAGTENLYKGSGLPGDRILPANFVFGSYTDGRGYPMSGLDTSPTDYTSSEPLYCSIQGYPDPDGSITGAAGTLLEHPGHIIYHLMRYGSAVPTAKIHIQSLKTMVQLLAGWKFVANINDFANCGDVVDRLASQCLAARLQLAGKIGFVTLATDAAALANIKTFDQIRQSVVIERTPNDVVLNNIQVNYGLDPTTGNYLGTTYANRLTNSTCLASTQVYGERPRATVELPDIHDTDTVDAYVNRLVSLKSYRHDVIAMEVPYWVGWDLVEGDAANLTITEGSSLDGNGWVDEPCVLVERQLLGRTIKQRWWRVATD